MSWQPKVSLCDWCYRHTGAPDALLDTLGILKLAEENNCAVELLPPEALNEAWQFGMQTPVHLPALPGNVPAYRVGLCSRNEIELAGVKVAYKSAIKKAHSGESIIVFTGLVEKEDESDFSRLTDGLNEIADFAKEYNVNILLEHLNNKGTHPDCMEGHTGYRGHDIHWVADAVNTVDSFNCKLLFDVYHVARLYDGVEGLIRRYARLIGHVHVAGVMPKLPNRRSLDTKGQLVDYTKVLRVLKQIDYQGYIGLEYIRDAKRDVKEELAASLKILRG